MVRPGSAQPHHLAGAREQRDRGDLHGRRVRVPWHPGRVRPDAPQLPLQEFGAWVAAAAHEPAHAADRHFSPQLLCLALGDALPDDRDDRPRGVLCAVHAARGLGPPGRASRARVPTKLSKATEQIAIGRTPKHGRQ